MQNRAARRVGDGHGHPGVIHEQLLAGLMRLTHGDVQPLGFAPSAEILGETAVPISLSILRGVLMPQLFQRHALPSEFALDVRPIGLCPLLRGDVDLESAIEQCLFERIVIKFGWEGPAYSGAFGSFKVTADGSFTDLAAFGNLAGAELHLEGEAEDFSNLSHGSADT